MLTSFMDGAIFDLIFKANIFFFLIETFHTNKIPVFLFVCFVLGLQVLLLPEVPICLDLLGWLCLGVQVNALDC